MSLTRRILVLSAVLHAFLFFVVPLPASWVESLHARGIFPVLRSLLSTPLALLPVSLGQVGLVVVVGFVCLLATQSVLRLLGRRDSIAFLRWLPLALAVTVHGYLLGFGWLYHRPPLATRLALDLAVSGSEIDLAAVEAARAARRQRCQPPEGFGAEVAGDLAREALQATLPLIGEGPLPALRLKPVFPRGFLLFFGTSGIFSPFTQEANVDPGLDPLHLAVTAAHELAHLAGFASEDEASFVAWLACKRSPERFLRYAAHVAALSRLERRLPRARRAEVAKLAGPEVAADRKRAADTYRSSVSPGLSRASLALYDGFLKSQGVAKGVRSYDAMTVLLLAWRKRERDATRDNAK